jgi:hypothetical protein
MFIPPDYKIGKERCHRDKFKKSEKEEMSVINFVGAGGDGSIPQFRNLAGFRKGDFSPIIPQVVQQKYIG